MCTVTWWRAADGGDFGVWFNRDERRTRPASEPVRAQATKDGTAFLAPRDPAAGGTWLLANAHGLVVGVLNFYAAAEVRAFLPSRSRGTLPLRQADARSVDDVERTMAKLALADYAPFILVAWDRARTAAWSWDGAALSVDPAPAAPLTTSSYRSAEICAWRRARFAAVVDHPDRANLAAYHDDAAHEDPAFNVRMRRPDARTESVCEVNVTPTEVRFRHRRESPERLGALDVHELVLARK